MEQQFKVVGAKHFNDTVEGTKYDNTKLRVELKEKEVLSETRSVVGYNTIDMDFGTSENFSKFGLAKLAYPLMAMLEVEFTTKGLVCSGFKVIQQSKAPVQA